MQGATSEEPSALLPNLYQETELDILAGLDILAPGNANTTMARVKIGFSYAGREGKNREWRTSIRKSTNRA